MVFLIDLRMSTLVRNYFIFETNNFTAMTKDSILAQDPNANIVVSSEIKKSKVAQVLETFDEPVLALTSGVVYVGDKRKVPYDIILKNPMAVSNMFVFWDHPKHHLSYQTVGITEAAGKAGDLNVFYLNPKFWVRHPDQDTVRLRKVKKTWMPRFMNHRNDPLLRETMPVQQCLYYNCLGLSANILNYVAVLERGEATINETFSYPFDLLLPFSKSLPQEEKEYVEFLGNKTKDRVGTLRNGLAKLNNLVN